MIRTILFLAIIFMSTQLFAFRADESVSGPGKVTTLSALKTAPQKIPTADQKEAVNSLDGTKVEWDAKTGAPASIRGKDLSAKNLGGKGFSLSPKNDFAVDAVAVMDRLTKAYRLRDASAEFKPLKTEADELGFHHVRMNQMYQGLRVFGGQLIVHFNKSGQAYQVNGRYIPDINVATKATIDANSAVAAAQGDLVQMGKPAGNIKGKAELVIYAQDISPLLAYELTLVYNDEKAGAGNWRYWINAHDGSVINRYNNIPKADATITGNLNTGEGGGSVSVTGDYSSNYYYLRYTGKHWEIYDYPNRRTARSSTANWGTTTSLRSEISAAYNFNAVQTYYLNFHSRNSYNNSGATAKVNVHKSGGTDNAYWSSDTQAFYFYPGSDFGELTVLDVCAHEFTHAVTDYSANLIYYGESGALNESFSDIFGTVVEFANQPDGRSSYPERMAGYADWLLGEDCTYPYDVALRDMRDPQRYDDPSKYHGTNWYYGSGDNGGVHYNSGVQNHFFYLLSEGGKGTNDGISYSITGIGVENAHLIAYRALTVYCTSDTDYNAARTAWISAATDLNSSWVSAVQAAWLAVGVDSGTLQFSESSASVNDNAGNVTLTVMRTDGSCGAASVNYVTANGTATAGTDYTATSGTLNWANDTDNSKTIKVTIINRSGTQASRAFTVGLSGASGASLGSPTSITVTIDDVLTPPTGVSATDETYTDKVLITWSAASGATGYQIFRYTRYNSASAEQIGTATSNTYDDTSAVAGTNYYYWVKSTNSAGISGFSSYNTGSKAVVSSSLAAPENLQASDGTYTDTIRVSWNSASGASSYQVWRNAINDSSSASLLKTTSSRTYRDTSATTPGLTLYYWVKAKNSSGVSVFSTPDIGYAQPDIGPTIKANGATDTVTVNYPEPVSVTVGMYAGDYEGEQVDWWVVALAGTSWYYMNNSFQWTQLDENFRPVYQGALGNLPETEVLNIRLGSGSYTFWFAVDYPMDGILNYPDGPILVDSVNVIVQ